jgi:hypothetical protein
MVTAELSNHPKMRQSKTGISTKDTQKGRAV